MVAVAIAIVRVALLCQVGYVARFMFPVYKPRTFISSGYQGTLGWGIATAVGAQSACMDKKVVSIAGDGGALYTISEVATAVHHKIPVTVSTSRHVR